MATSKEQAVKDYADFEEKVKRTIYIDQLSPQVTSPVIKAALAQCANVVNVEFIVNYTIPYDIPCAVLVELDDEMQAKAAVELMNDFPFIIGGMPRPVRATYAKPEMFRDRPPRPGIKKEFCWVKQGDDEHETMKKLKNLAKRQEAENMALVKTQLEEEKELAKQQQELLDGNCKKYDMLDTVIQNGTIKNLAHRYGVNLDD
ncbi:ASI1-immunoprecipitated protein 1-like [Phragmites australis]|uniref:ASI1-immunoprecipitated protein 1-like n=1 Tax=Phragmites australis TaxID=29695 RepID=UPI002D79F12F|nr:ASI1-immunoprecipitated protein 1-like [Phragmites australis]XP_062227240.1 ASI1-immunoprecipitated protein 1-like [Phragmites australis]XP_062227241.1 ASI1-immunoprecipitated protein 1-like [Phragmites australis]